MVTWPAVPPAAMAILRGANIASREARAETGYVLTADALKVERS
jgi:hypothetical protein